MDINYIEKYELIDGYAIVDNDFSIITANENMYKFIGISTKYTVTDIIHQVDIDDFIDIANTLRMNQQKSIVLRMKRVDNSYRWVLVDIKRCRINENAETEYLELNVNDIFALKKYNSSLQNTITSFRHILAMDDELFYVYEYNDGSFTMYRFIDNEMNVIISKPLKDAYNYLVEKNYIPKEYISEYQAILKDIIDGKTMYSHKIHYNVCNDGDIKTKLTILKGSTLYSEMKPSRSVGSVKIIDGDDSFSKNTFDFAYHSSNLSSIDDFKKYCLDNVKYNPNCHLTLIRINICNLDEYKLDKGFVAANEIINIVKDTIQKVVEYRGIITAIDDNEFAIVVKNINKEVELRAFLEYLRTRISWQCRFYDSDYKIEFSIGISRYPDNGTDWKLLEKKVRRAIEIAKEKGGNRYIIFKEALHKLND
ncbi:MAG: GGDEF domain-containing protein [Lachnospira sp.]